MLVVEKDEARDTLLSVPDPPDRAVHPVPPATPGNFAIHCGSLERVNLLVATHAEHDEWAVSIFFDQLALQWMQSDAGAAPVGGKCQQHHLTLIFAETKTHTVCIETVDFRGWFSGEDVTQFEYHRLCHFAVGFRFVEGS